MILRGGLLKTHPGGGPGRWCQIKNVKKIIYMIIRGGLLKTHPGGGPERWSQIKNVK
jgi:hypothetical protein